MTGRNPFIHEPTETETTNVALRDTLSAVRFGLAVLEAANPEEQNKDLRAGKHLLNEALSDAVRHVEAELEKPDRIEIVAAEAAGEAQ